LILRIVYEDSEADQQGIFIDVNDLDTVEQFAEQIKEWVQNLKDPQ